MSEILKINDDIASITCHVWNGDRSQIAICPNNNKVKIYKNDNNTWKLEQILNAHDSLVTGIDWAPKTNRLVTCSADRNAYVWDLDDSNKFNKSMVMLRINRAATCVKWSPNEDKFAVGSGARLISVCYFEKENSWWVAKHIKKPIRSTITCLDWHPNNVLLAAGSSDFKVRIFATNIKELGEKSTETEWQGKMSFGQMLASFPSNPVHGGWVYCVNFSPEGDKIAWVAHDSSINVGSKDGTVQKLKTKFAPFLAVTWISKNTLVAAGHEYKPTAFMFNEQNELVFGSNLDDLPKKTVNASSAIMMFQNLDKLATGDNSTTLSSIHQNSVKNILIYQGKKEDAVKLSTGGLDGQIVLWDLKSLEKLIPGFKIV